MQMIEAELGALESDQNLEVETNLAARASALDFLAFVGEIIRVSRREEGLPALVQRVESLRARLTGINERLFQRLRTAIQRGDYTLKELRREFNRYTMYSAEKKGEAHIGYDGLDILMNGLLEIDIPPRETRTRHPDMIQYEATPARAILDLLDNAGLERNDVFYDLGAGLGQVVILIGLLSRIKAKGVEIEPAFCDLAARGAAKLGLTNVEFINADARDVDYNDGTVFFLFTPFKGAIWQAVLDRLRQEGERRPIKICTYGPCTIQAAKQPWLRSIDGNADHEYKLAIFRSV